MLSKNINEVILLSKNTLTLDKEKIITWLMILVFLPFTSSVARAKEGVGDCKSSSGTNSSTSISMTTNSCLLAVASGTAKSRSTKSDPYTIKVENYLPVAMNAYLVNSDGSWKRLETHWNSANDVGKNSRGTYAAISPAFLDISNAPDFSYHKNAYFSVDTKNMYFVLTDLVNGGLVASYYLYDDTDKANGSLGSSGDECGCAVDANRETVHLYVNDGVLAVPNMTGGPPTMTTDIPIPGDTMPFLVGASLLGKYAVKNKNDKSYNEKMTPQEKSAYDSSVNRVLTRHQYWSQTANSLVVPAGEYVNFTTQTFYGTEDESSSSSQFSASMGLSASAGYGPMSASISASLSASSNYAHNLTVQTSTTETVTRTIDNTKKGATDHIVQYYQLTDLLTVSGWDSNLNAMLANAVIIQKNSPALPAIQGPDKGSSDDSNK